MSHSVRVVATLKKLLRARGITYKQLAPRLGLSEASVKRIFAEGDFSLERLEAVCEVAGTDLFGLMQLAGQAGERPRYHLTVAQEKALAADHRLFVLFHWLLRGDKLARIQRERELTKAETTQLLVQLDRLKLLELHPGGRIRLLVPRLVRWITDGPLAAKYGPALKEQFFQSGFTGRDEYIRLLWNRMSPRTRQLVARKLSQLVAEIEEMVDLEPSLEGDAGEAAEPFAVLLAYRPLNLKLSFG